MPTSPKENERAHVAYHEAGHAVVISEFGWPIQRCHIRPPRAAVTMTPPAVYPRTVEECRQRAMVSLAGICAEDIEFGEFRKVQSMWDPGGDLYEARWWARQGGSPKASVFMEDTYAILRSRWASVESLAAELLRETEVDGETVTRIFSQYVEV